MKKTLSMVLALVMLMSTISCLGITASAAADGIKYFTMEFLIDDELVANKKLTIDYASEDSYRKQCEDYLYAEGNVLTMYTTDGGKIVYESIGAGLYAATDTEENILSAIKEFFGLSNDGKLLTAKEIFVDDVNVTGDKNDYFTVKLSSGLTTEVYVDLVGYPENFPVAIEYIPAVGLTVIENCCGYESNGQFFYDDITINQDGDRLILDYIGQPDVEYVFEDGKYFDDNYNALKGSLTVDADATVESQIYRAWTTATKNNYATVTYTAEGQSVSGTVPVKVVKSEVNSIKYVENTALEVFENSCGEWNENFVYDLDHFKKVAGNQIIVEYVDGARVTYTADKNGSFKSDSGDVLDENHFYWESAQTVKPWSIDNGGVITISYLGAESQVNVDVLENPIASVEYSSPEILKVKEGVDGEWYTNNDGDKDFYYSCDDAIYVKGSSFTVNFKDGTSSVYNYVSGKTFKNDKGEALDIDHVKVTAYSQDSKAWEINNEYDFQVTYLGVTCDVPVKVIPSAVPATPKTKAANVVDGIKVTWNTIAEAESYNVYRRAEGEKTWSFISNLEGSEYLDKNVKNGKYYRYTVKAKNDNGLSKVDATGALIKCVATPVMNKINNATTGIYVDWTKVSGADHYRVYRRAAGETSWKFMGQTRNLWWVDKGVVNANGGYYRYTVRAVAKTSSGDTYSGYEAGLLMKRLANPMVKSATDCATGIEIKWKMIPGSQGYYVYRKVVGAAETTWVRLGSAEGVKNTSYIDTTAEKGVAYQYTVRAYYGKILSAYNSGVIYGAPDMPELKTIANTTEGVKITWGKAARADAYRVYRRFAGGSWVLLGTTTETSYLDSTAPNGQYVAYTVRGVNNVGFSTYNTQGLLTRFVATPKLTSATYNAKAKAVTVKWGAVAGATEYHVYRRVAGGSWVLIDSTNTNYFVDKDVKANGYYAYTVRAINGWRSSYESGIAVNTVADTDKF